MWEQKEWGHNLILNDGMDRLAIGTWASVFDTGILGTDGFPNSIDSLSATAVCDSAGTVTIDGGSYTFAGTDVDNILQWDSGQEHRITNFVDAGTVRVTPFPTGGTITPDLFTLYHTNRILFGAETKKTRTYLTGAPFCTTFRTGNVISMRRTFDFTAETGTVTYREVGVGWVLSPPTFNNSTFSRIVIPGGLTLVVTQQLRLTYQLEVTLTPTVEANGSVPIVGWPLSPAATTNGTWGIQYIGLGAVLTSGGHAFNATVDVGGNGNEPAQIFGDAFFMTSTNTALTAFGATPPTRTLVGVAITPTLTNQDYTGVVYTHEKTGTWTPLQSNSGSIFGIGIGEQFTSLAPQSRPAFIVVFDEAQTKRNTDQFSFNLGYTWSRTLIPD